MFSARNSKNEYSNKEHVVGKWYGEPLYRKVLWTKLNGTKVELAHGIENLGRVTKLYGTGVDENGANFPIPKISFNVQDNILIYASKDRIVLASNNAMNYKGAYVVLEYTKS